ncbi:hypothetical protein [Dyella silvatica]|uniref:hypothetical protein n=1 Tax=Dyella silvatica TaxID=2992128 RepID=UPI00225BEC66|nr:hypothetical protein [Dyella silvatica]
MNRTQLKSSAGAPKGTQKTLDDHLNEFFDGTTEQGDRPSEHASSNAKMVAIFYLDGITTTSHATETTSPKADSAHRQGLSFTLRCCAVACTGLKAPSLQSDALDQVIRHTSPDAPDARETHSMTAIAPAGEA